MRWDHLVDMNTSTLLVKSLRIIKLGFMNFKSENILSAHWKWKYASAWCIWHGWISKSLVQIQGRIQVWANPAPTPLVWQLNHANSAYFGAIYQSISPKFRYSASRPPLFCKSWIRPEGYSPWKGVRGRVALKTPFSCSLSSSLRPPFQHVSVVL